MLLQQVQPRGRACVRREARLESSRCGRATPPRAARSRVVIACASDERLWTLLGRENWDTAPRSWRSFWATKLAAAVVETDAAQQVRVTPVEGLGLSLPPNAEEAQRRVRTNLVLYRQNYLLVFLALAALGALRHANLLAGLAALAVAAACSSDRLLGEAALASEGRLLWNDARVAGVDRASLRAASAACGVLCLALSPEGSVRWLLRTATQAGLLALAHALLRPVDLGSAFASFWSGVKSAKTREDVGAAFLSMGQQLGRWWGDAKTAPPPEPVPIVVVQRGTPPSQPPPQPQQPRLPRGR